MLWYSHSCIVTLFINHHLTNPSFLVAVFPREFMNVSLPLVDVVLSSVESEAYDGWTTVPFGKLKLWLNVFLSNCNLLPHTHTCCMFITILSVILHSIISSVASYLNRREGSSVLLSSIRLQLTMCAHHLTFVAESKLGLWLLQDVDVRPIMVDGWRARYCMTYE